MSAAHSPRSIGLGSVLLLAATILLGPSVAMAAKATGTFTTESRCPMFQSKAKRTNPGDVHSSPGRDYQVIEVLPVRRAAAWYRVRVPGVRVPRWVEARCGTVQAVSTATTASDTRRPKPDRKPASHTGAAHRPVCNTADRFDAHVLALTWQPAFCEWKDNSPPECANLTANSFTAGNLALHGLWPNRRQCGKDYGFCGAVRSKQPFCSYPKLELTRATRTALERIMPSAAEPRGCLQRHEYWKHGACRAGGAEDYYRLSIGLVQQINASTFVTRFLRSRAGSRVERHDLSQAFDAAFGAGASRRLSLQCRDGMLVELRLNLPAALDRTKELSELIQGAARARHQGNCRRPFRIDSP